MPLKMRNITGIYSHGQAIIRIRGIVLKGHTIMSVKYGARHLLGIDSPKSPNNIKTFSMSQSNFYLITGVVQSRRQ